MDIVKINELLIEVSGENTKLHLENKVLKSKLELYENGVIYSSENDQLKNNWNELKEWLEERKFVYNITEEDLDEDTSITEVLIKMQEIESGKNE